MAVAVAIVQGPEAALAEVKALECEGRLSGYRYLQATLRPGWPNRAVGDFLEGCRFRGEPFVVVV